MSLMPNEGLAIKLAPTERMQLEQWAAAQGTPQQVALRCRIVLAALAGEDNVAIAHEQGVSRPTVQLWRRRVHAGGIGEVWKIAPGGQLQNVVLRRAHVGEAGFWVRGVGSRGAPGLLPEFIGFFRRDAHVCADCI